MRDRLSSRTVLDKPRSGPGSDTSHQIASKDSFAFVPSTVLSVPGLWVPLVVVENVHILPGVPVLFERMINSQKERLRQEKVCVCVCVTVVCR